MTDLNIKVGMDTSEANKKWLELQKLLESGVINKIPLPSFAGKEFSLPPLKKENIQLPPLSPVPYTDMAKIQKVMDKTRMSFLTLGLGVMFAGMAVQRSMTALFGSAQEASGITQIFSDALTVFFLPAMIFLIPLAIKFFEVLNSIPEPLKVLIGLGAVLIFVIGGLAAFFGQIITLVSSLSGAKIVFSALNEVVGIIAATDTAKKFTEASSAISKFFQTPLGFAVGGAALSIATLYVTDLIWKNWGQNAETTSENTKQGYANAMGLSKEYLGTNNPLAWLGETFAGAGAGGLSVLESILKTPIVQQSIQMNRDPVGYINNVNLYATVDKNGNVQLNHMSSIEQARTSG